MTTDTPKHQGLRARLVRELREKGISDERVLAAIGQVPRHLFLDASFEALAYSDQALPILNGQTISQPSTVAFQSQLLELQEGMSVLEIGTGSGYQTAVLCQLGAKVYSIERQSSLFEKTRQTLRRGCYTAQLFLGDGYAGLTGKDYPQFDRVLVTCGAPFVPPALFDQLKVGGLMVIPQGGQQLRMTRVTKLSPTEMRCEDFGDCRFVPMLEGRNY